MMIARCQSLPHQFHLRDDQDLIKDALYILSCINQYQYPRRKGQQDQDRRRDTALLRGVLFPYVRKDSPELTQPVREKLVHLTKHLAFHLRQYRRKVCISLPVIAVSYFNLPVSIISNFIAGD